MIVDIQATLVMARQIVEDLDEQGSVVVSQEEAMSLCHALLASHNNQASVKPPLWLQLAVNRLHSFVDPSNPDDPLRSALMHAGLERPFEVT